jgi:GTP-binding protein Era
MSADNDEAINDQVLKHCGYVAIIGRPNVGKSTLINRILGQKISIATRKPQTTRHRILGIKTTDNAQVLYVDTPGLHRGVKRAINRYMNRAAVSIMNDVDVIVFVVDGLYWTGEDQYILEKLKLVKTPVILVINKIDKIKDKEILLPRIKELSEKAQFVGIIPVSAVNGENVARLEATVTKLLPMGMPLFPHDQITDRSERFLAAELIREKLMSRLSRELPYALTVEIKKFSLQNNILNIDALIWVEREPQKAIVIGKQGSLLKTIGMQARKDMEKAFGNQVFLQLWVKVRKGWADDEQALRSLGYME